MDTDDLSENSIVHNTLETGGKQANKKHYPSRKYNNRIKADYFIFLVKYNSKQNPKNKK